MFLFNALFLSYFTDWAHEKWSQFEFDILSVMNVFGVYLTSFFLYTSFLLLKFSLHIRHSYSKIWKEVQPLCTKQSTPKCWSRWSSKSKLHVNDPSRMERMYLILFLFELLVAFEDLIQLLFGILKLALYLFFTVISTPRFTMEFKTISCYRAFFDNSKRRELENIQNHPIIPQEQPEEICHVIPLIPHQVKPHYANDYASFESDTVTASTAEETYTESWPQASPIIRKNALTRSIFISGCASQHYQTIFVKTTQIG